MRRVFSGFVKCAVVFLAIAAIPGCARYFAFAELAGVEADYVDGPFVISVENSTSETIEISTSLEVIDANPQVVAPGGRFSSDRHARLLVHSGDAEWLDVTIHSHSSGDELTLAVPVPVRVGVGPMDTDLYEDDTIPWFDVESALVWDIEVVRLAAE